jgi:hypothetical protein
LRSINAANLGTYPLIEHDSNSVVLGERFDASPEEAYYAWRCSGQLSSTVPLRRGFSSGANRSTLNTRFNSERAPNTGETTMKNLAVAAAVVASTWSPASAKTMACTGENFAKMTERMATMPHGPKRMAMMREMAVINTDLSNGDLRGACKHYVIAQRIQNNERDPFANLHFE